MRSIKWELTKKCNLRCSHCYYYDSNPSDKDIDPETAKKIVDNLARLDYENIILSAKEPFLYDHFFELLYYIKEKGLHVSLNTNGTSMKEEDIRRLIGDKLVGIFTIGLDGICEESNSFLRGKGSFYKSLNTIETINRIRGRKKRPKISVNYTFNNRNIGEVTDVIPFFAEKRIDILNVSYVSSVGNAEKNDTNSKLTNLMDVYETLAEKYKEYGIPFHLNLIGCPPFLLSYYNLKYGLRFRIRYGVCTLGDHGFFIDSQGIAHGCEMLSNYDKQEDFVTKGPKVDITQLETDYIFSSEQLRFMKSLKDVKYEYCKDCELQDLCKPCPIVPKKSIQRPFLISCYESKEKLMKEREAFINSINDDSKTEFYRDIKHEPGDCALTLTVISHRGISKVKYKLSKTDELIYHSLMQSNTVSDAVKNVKKQINEDEQVIKSKLCRFLLFFAERGYLRLTKPDDMQSRHERTEAMEGYLC